MPDNNKWRMQVYGFCSYVYKSSRIAFFLNKEEENPALPVIHWIRRAIGFKWSRGFIGILITEPNKVEEEK